jgi:hypothetical protein
MGKKIEVLKAKKASLLRTTADPYELRKALARLRQRW